MTLFSSAMVRRVEAAARRGEARAGGSLADDLSDDEEFWREIQQAFSVPRGIINLDNGCTCPSPRIVTEAMVRYAWREQEAPCHVAGELWPMIERVRGDLAGMLGCDSQEVAIVRNATEALDTVLLGLELRRGDEVVTTTHDYWAMLDALEQRSRREGIVVRKIPVPTPPRSLDDLADAFARAITPKTRLVLVSHPVNLTGQLFPIRRISEIAHRAGAEVLVDGAHSFAHLDMKITDLGCDYFGASLHKWLLAPVGTGLLYVKRDKIGKVWPLVPAPAAQRESIKKFEYTGTVSVAPFIAIAEAIAFHRGIGAKRKEDRLRRLTHYWAERVAGLPKVRMHTSLAPEMSCGLATFEIEGVHPKALTSYLWEKHRILVQAMVDDAQPAVQGEFRGVRVTPNVYTMLPELDAFSEVIERVVRKGLPAPQ